MNTFLNGLIKIMITVYLLITPITASAQVEIISEPGADLSSLKELQQTVDAFNEVIKNKLQTDWQENVQVFICPDRNSFLTVAERETGDPQSKKVFEQSIYAFSQLSQQKIFIDQAGGKQKAQYERAEILSSFLFRSLWYQLNNKTMPNDIKVETSGTLNYLYWMNEGTGHYIGALVSEMLGFRSLKKWERERVIALRGLLKPMTEAEMQILGVSSWANFLIPGAAYKADVAAAYLFETAKPNGLKTIPLYYQRSADTKNAIAVWEASYELNYGEFIQNFISWYNRKVLLL